jgi:hypothetical protein
MPQKDMDKIDRENFYANSIMLDHAAGNNGARRRQPHLNFLHCVANIPQCNNGVV